MDARAANQRLLEFVPAQRAFPTSPLEGAVPRRSPAARIIVADVGKPSSEDDIYDATRPAARSGTQA
eukprot:8971966-Pyramimonas_sp.AAC.1